jgi:hypothetical protein
LLVASIWVGCAKRKIYDSLYQSGYVYCNGPIGQFNVVLSRDTDDPSLYDLQVQPLEVPRPGDIIRIAIANANQQYRDLLPETRITRGQAMDLGQFSRDDITLYPILVMVPYTGDSSPTFLYNSASTGVICNLPTTDNQTGYPL